MEDEIKPSKKRVSNNIDSVRSLIKKEENSMTKRKLRFKPLIIAAIVVAVSALSLVTVNAAPKGIPVKFIMGGEEIEGEYIDYVDGDGFRRISFNAVVPLYEQKYAIICDVDAPQGENVRVITEETDPEFFENLRLYIEAKDKASEEIKALWRKIKALKGEEWDETEECVYVREDIIKEAVQLGIIDPSEEPQEPKPEDFGLVFKDSEYCAYRYGDNSKTSYQPRDGALGGEFMRNVPTKTERVGGGSIFKHSFRYYVGKE